MSTSGILPTSGTLHNNSIGNFEIPSIVRTWINDLDSSSYKYSDGRINQIICVAARFVQQDADFKTRYNIGIDYISPNPAEVVGQFSYSEDGRIVLPSATTTTTETTPAP